jgi:outer membrane biogenesis lipoprotein LolB
MVISYSCQATREKREKNRKKQANWGKEQLQLIKKLQRNLILNQHKTNYLLILMKIRVRIKQTKYSRGIWGVIVIACLLVGCKSSTGVTSSTTAIMKTEEALFTSVLNRSFSFDTFSARFHLDFSGMQQELGSKVQLKMICDDRMQISIQPFLGIEMFRIEISNDSIKMLDKMNKRFMVDSYQQLKKEMGIDFNYQNLQALITNQLFIPGENRISTNHFRRFRVTNANNLAEFQLKDRNESFYTFTADGDERLLSTVIEYGNQIFSWHYSQFQTLNNQAFPLKMVARLSSVNQTQGTATLTFSTPEINHPVTMDFNIPSGYNRVTLEQMINSIKK